MTRNGIILAMCLATVGCKENRKAGSAPPDSARPDTTAPPTFTDEGRGAQRRIGRYLQDAIVTDKLRTCWAKLQGEGAVAIDLKYQKSGDNWTFENAKVTKSALAKGQDAIAQQCIEESARGTTFAVDSKEALETGSPAFVVRLGWPVPLPPAGTETSSGAIARMIGTGGGSGVITIPGCSDCVPNPNYPYGRHCVKKKSGSNVDCEEINTNLCATTTQACVSGAFGGTRGVIIF